MGDDRGSEPLGGDDGEASDETADCKVHEHALLPVPGADPKCHEEAADDDDASVGQEAGCDDEAAHVLDGTNGRLSRCVHDDDDGADDAQEAAGFADETQPFLEEDGGEDGGNDDGQGAQGGDQDGIDAVEF